MMGCIIETKWPTSKIRELCDVSRGSSPRPIADKRYFDGGHIPWIKIADATKSGKYLHQTKEYVNDYGASFSKILPAGTIIVAASGTLGYTQILGVSGCAHDGWLILTNLKNFDKDYAYYVLQQMQQHFYNSAYGAAIQNINTEILRETQIPHPSLQIQRKIAAILSAYDDLIENNLRRIKILEEMAQNLYREWFVNFCFPGHEQTRFIDSPLGRIPEGWDEAVLNDMAQIITGYAFKSKDWVDKGIPVIKIKNIRPGNIVDTENADCITETLSKKTNDKYRLENGDYLIAMTGATAGKIGKLRSKEPMLLNQRVAKIKPKIIFSEYIWCSICPPDTEKTFYALSDGAAQPNMSGEQIENYKLIKPSGKVIIEFNNKVHPMLSLVDKLYFQNHNLRHTRDLLLPKLISGELDISDLEITLPEAVLT